MFKISYRTIVFYFYIHSKDQSQWDDLKLTIIYTTRNVLKLIFDKRTFMIVLISVFREFTRDNNIFILFLNIFFISNIDKINHFVF